MTSTPQSYREFWPHYVRAHSRRATQLFHVAATVLGAAFCIAVVIEGEPLLLPLGALVAYAVAIPSHFLFEGNRPTVKQHPLWSARADMHMFTLLLAGRMGEEVESASVGA